MPEDRLHPSVRVLLAALLFTFFGGGLALFVNLFVPFMNETAFCIVALIVMAELLVLFIVGKYVQVMSALRSLNDRAAVAQAARRDKKS